MHLLSGTMAISETPLKDVALMTIDEINAQGGVLGKSWNRWWLTRPRTGRYLLKSKTTAESGQGGGSFRLLDIGVA